MVTRYHNRRRGLAPLELVMSVPIVMMVTALSIVFATTACWRFRGQVAARDALWSQRWPRVPNPIVPGVTDPQPAGWPGTWTRNGGAPLTELNAIAAFQHPILRGPLPNVIVDTDLFDPSERLYVGQASADRLPPLLPKLGPLHISGSSSLLEGTWQYRPMGLSSNNSRRFPRLYQISNPNPSKEAAWQAAVAAITSNPQRASLLPLDQDDEFLAWYGTAPDFHPRLTRFCGLDVNTIRTNNVLPLITRIDGQPQMGTPPPPAKSGVPAVMAKRFIAMYQQQLASLQILTPPPLGPIGDLQQKIETLQNFLGTLP